jgi:hypothetical protein
MPNDITFTIAGYEFSPAPDISINQNLIRVASGHVIGVGYSATITGTLTTLRKGCGNSLGCSFALINELREALQSCDCTRLTLTCNDYPLIDAFVRVISASFSESNDHWVMTVPYTITVEWQATQDLAVSGEPDCLSCLTNISDSWEVRQLEGYYQYDLNTCGLDDPPRYFSITRNLSATGVDCCAPSGDVTPGWQVARDWVLSQMGISGNEDMIQCQAALNFNPSDFSFVDHIRSKSVDKYNGSFSLAESWTAISNTGVPHCLEEFSVESNTSTDSRQTTYTIQGTITGGEVRNANFEVTKTKFASAEECWTVVEPLILDRINCLGNIECPVHPIPLTKQIGKNPTSGLITYSYSYNDRPASLITGAIAETITITDGLATDRTTEIPVIGRGSSILVACGTNWLTKTVSISAVMPRPESCYPSGNLCTRFNGLLDAPDGAVDDLICCIQNALTSVYDQVIVSSNEKNYSPITGVYNRTVTFTMNDCSLVPPTGFC